ncbi:MAG: ATP-dependent Clp protease ATP-binding subunit [Simkaniaceae bacterium]|nr:MAG: ATP-dependent Clp protease ATP-binding subunit [Simkaniaceae bacterium]
MMKFYAEVPHLSERSAVRAPKQPEFIQEMKGTDVIYIGREDLVDNVLDVICADIKNNNVILLGEPGIGKTQMARFLAAQIQKGELTDLQGYRVFASTAKDLIAGAKYVGAKEERIKELFSFLKGVDEEVILFIDEIWQLIGTGIGERGTTDIAGTLLTEIEDQGVVVIGATTPKEGGFLLRNRAFLDRFQIVEVEPMSQAERTEILKAHIRKYQERGISIPDDFAEIISGINLKGGGRSLRKDIDMLGIIVSRMKRKGISAEQAARERGLLQLDRSPTGDK